MKAIFEDISSKKGNESFLAYRFTVPAFEFKWHYHPEYELTLITKGTGKRLVGDRYESFQTGDLVLLGPDLPHTWSSEVVNTQNVSAVVIQFTENFMNNFLQLTEFSKVSSLLSASSRGLSFPNAFSLYRSLEVLPELVGVEKVTSLLTILQKLTEQKCILLSSEYFNPVKGEETENRINKVCQYVQRNASKNITLAQAADLIHLSRSAFSKFFRRATGKTFSDYVNDIRIGNACYLLTESDKAINEIAYETGFESLTYFNRVFLKKKQVTPRKFRHAIESK
jgi:AraC-like DNA-binding protein